MHELSLARGLVERLEKIANAEKALRVERVLIQIGAYSGVERAAFEFAFPFAAEGSLCEGAALEIEETPVRVACGDCGADSNPEPTLIQCACCGSANVEIQGGREFTIKTAELEIP